MFERAERRARGASGGEPRTFFILRDNSFLKDNTMLDTISLDGIEYIRKDKATPEVSGDYVIVRCRNAGIHAGYLESRDSDILTLKNSRRLWRWWSKFTLSGLAMSGILKGKESECKFACVLPKLELTVSDVCEVIYCTEESRLSLQSLPDHSND